MTIELLKFKPDAQGEYPPMVGTSQAPVARLLLVTGMVDLVSRHAAPPREDPYDITPEGSNLRYDLTVTPDGRGVLRMPVPEGDTYWYRAPGTELRQMTEGVATARLPEDMPAGFIFGGADRSLRALVVHMESAQPLAQIIGLLPLQQTIA